MSKKTLNAYLVSDSSGETVMAVSKAVFVQFPDVNVLENIFLLIRSYEQVNAIIETFQKKPGIVIYTMGNSEIKDYFLKQCKKFAIPAICPLQNVVSFISNKLFIQPSDTKPGKYKSLNKKYYSKINSINFAITHDDGQHTENYENADIVLLGVSRTSKSPTSLYLGQRGYNVANYPIINGLPISIPNLENFLINKKPVFIGLTISSYNLSRIRTSRLSMLCDTTNDIENTISNHYTFNATIQEEITYANAIFRSLDIQVIDVTNKAIEETAATIINTYLMLKN